MMPKPHPSQSYRTLAVETAGPGRLILMLFDGALRFLNGAQSGFDLEDLRERNETINNNLIKVQNIVTELQRSLDLDQGGEFAGNMYALYDFMNNQIMEANMKKAVEPIQTVARLLGEIREAWVEMLEKEPEDAVGLTHFSGTA
jgi:flagellar protein FliS